MSVQSVGQDTIPRDGWGEVVNGESGVLTGSGTTTVIAGNTYPLWVGSWNITVAVAAAGETVTLQTSGGKVLHRVPLDAALDVSRSYRWGFRVPAGEDVEAVVSGGTPDLAVSVEGMRKQPQNQQT